MNRTDVLSWLLAVVIVAAILAGAFFTLAVLRPDASWAALPAGSLSVPSEAGPYRDAEQDE